VGVMYSSPTVFQQLFCAAPLPPILFCNILSRCALGSALVARSDRCPFLPLICRRLSLANS
jgi:hypothetical protein